MLLFAVGLATAAAGLDYQDRGLQVSRCMRRILLPCIAVYPSQLRRVSSQCCLWGPAAVASQVCSGQRRFGHGLALASMACPLAVRLAVGYGGRESHYASTGT